MLNIMLIFKDDIIKIIKKTNPTSAKDIQETFISGIEDQVIGMYAKGMITRDNASNLLPKWIKECTI
ncbi:MAG: hypothetical protein K0R54_5037 [Clostridiaceae bacterium]|jgi:hypothetical protein|nr:hypothetical protein [Clostridiaceae bacterium]